MIKVSIVGASGYTGGELVRILIKHPHVQLTHLTSESYAGKTISAVHSWLKGRCDIACEKLDINEVADDSDVVFLCLPHGMAFLPAIELVKAGKKIIDLSADFRLNDPRQYQVWYHFTHPEPRLLKKAVFGSPELYRTRIKKAQLIANPGCYATAVILALAPLMAGRLAVKHGIVADAKSGVSGAGRTLNLKYHYSEANENLLAYAVGHHRHTPEIEQELSHVAKSPVTISFTPHLIPMNRGILATSYVRLKKSTSTRELIKKYRKFYAKEPYVIVLSEDDYPETKNVCNTNYCHIGLHVDTHNNTAIIISAIDNLIKGASGQAVQNMNIMCGFHEMEGL